MAFAFQGIFYFASHPIVGIYTAIESMWSQKDHKYRGRGYSIHNTAVKDAVFQFIEVQKYAISAAIQFRFE